MIRRLLTIALLTAGCRSWPDAGDRALRDPRWWELSGLRADRRQAYQHLQLYQVLDSLPKAIAAADLRLAIVFYRSGANDSVRRAGTFEGTILPERTDGNTCVVVLAERVDWQGHRVGPSQRRLRTLIAPCLYLARFGRPGQGVAHWLAETGYQGLRSAEWIFRPGVLTLAFDYWYQSEPGEWIAPLLLALGRDRLPPYWSGPAAVGCLAGRASACDQFVRGPVRDRRGAAVPTVAGVAPAEDDYSPELSGRAQWVDDLIRTRGEALFGTFWRSELNLPAAFRAAYGEDLGPAVARWERHDWEQRRERAPVRLGAPIDAVAGLAGLGWCLLILLLPLVAARRRTMY